MKTYKIQCVIVENLCKTKTMLKYKKGGPWGYLIFEKQLIKNP